MMEAAERDTIVRRRKWFACDMQQELTLAYGPITNAELGRYYRARIIAEWAGCVTPEAERIAGNGYALELLHSRAQAIEEAADAYVKRSEKGRATGGMRKGNREGNPKGDR